MGHYTFRLPDIGEGIAEAEIVAWHIKVGDRIEEDARVADMMTDKATVEMESPVSGTVIEVAGEVGDVIAIGSALVVIEVEGEGEDKAGPAPVAEAVAERIEAENPHAGGVQELTPPPLMSSEVETPRATPAPRIEPHREGHGVSTSLDMSGKGGDKVLASPAVRARAQELGVTLSEVRPAEDGRIRHADLDAFLSYNAEIGRAHV